MIGWNLILAIIMAFWPTKGDPNRRSALVALWNSGESMNATTLMVYYCMRVILYMRRGKPNEASSVPGGKGFQPHPAVTRESPKIDSNVVVHTSEDAPLIPEKQNSIPDGYFDSNLKCGVSNLLWGLLFVFIALVMTAGNFAAGILVPVQLAMGNVAPADKDAIFYPNVPYYSRDDDHGAGISKLQSLKVPSAFRALGVAESLDFTVRKRVNLNSITANGSVELNYDYNVTGLDMGLLSDPKLKLMVNGSCRTDHTWLLSSTNKSDTYRLFGGNQTLEVKRQQGVDLPPMVNWRVNPNMGGGSNISYAMIVNTGGLYSYTSGQDPWYATEKTMNGALAYRVRGGRPALSCWEAKRWRLNGKEVDGSKLNTLHGLKLHKFWADKVFSLEFSVPLVLSVGRAVGSSALKSASFALGPEFILDAGASAILNDLERLVLASWVSGRNVLRDTTTYESSNMINLAKGSKGSAEVTTGSRPVDFVLQSADVVTLSVRILIAVPAILLFLFMLKCTLAYYIPHDIKFVQGPIFPGEKKNKAALLATQLHRGLDQRMTSRNWKHTESPFPFTYPTDTQGPITKK